MNVEDEEQRKEETGGKEGGNNVGFSKVCFPSLFSVSVVYNLVKALLLIWHSC